MAAERHGGLKAQKRECRTRTVNNGSEEKDMSELAEKPDTSAILDTVSLALGSSLVTMEPMGSRVTCSPPPTDTDEDWLLLVRGDPSKSMRLIGFVQDGSPQFYTGSDAGGFRSWRKGDVNLVTTPDLKFFDLFMTATHLAKRFNLMAKGDRIALFQAVLYGVRWFRLEEPGYQDTKTFDLSLPPVEPFEAKNDL
jgi:hypothetical protein